MNDEITVLFTCLKQDKRFSERLPKDIYDSAMNVVERMVKNEIPPGDVTEYLTTLEQLSFIMLMKLWDDITKEDTENLSDEDRDLSMDDLYDELINGVMDNNPHMYEFMKEKVIQNLIDRELYEKIDALKTRNLK
jgi:hypothetical protein